MIKKNLNRWILTLDGIEIHKTPSIKILSKLLGCSPQYIYKNLGDNNTFNHKKNNYILIDKQSQ